MRLRNRLVDSSGSLPARSLAAHPGEEPHQDQGTGGEQGEHQPEVIVGRQDARHHQDEADGGQDRSAGVEGARRIRRQGIMDPAAQHDDQRDDQGLEDERCPPADRRGDQAPEQRPGGGADAAHRADRAERAGPRGDPGEQQRREDVDRRDQQRRADALQDRVADDQDTQAGSGRAQQGADAVDDQAGGEAPLPAVAVGQLAAGDHQRRHHQQEDRDRDLHALHRGVQVLADVVDHHVHVRAGEAADELGQGQRNQRPSQRARRSFRRTRLSHPHLPSGRSCGIIPGPADPQITEAHRAPDTVRLGEAYAAWPAVSAARDRRPAHVPCVPFGLALVFPGHMVPTGAART